MYHRYRPILLLLLLWLSLLPQSAAADVHGFFRSAKGTVTEIVLDIAAPPPLSIIVEQQTPGGLIRSTSPQAAKINGERATWLLKKPAAGNLRLQAVLNAPPQASPRAVIKYQDPATGRYLQQQIVP